MTGFFSGQNQKTSPEVRLGWNSLNSTWQELQDKSKPIYGLISLLRRVAMHRKNVLFSSQLFDNDSFDGTRNAGINLKVIMSGLYLIKMI